jgi:ubiquinone/menaquinone biosynthesis C-methylase UbiE
VKIQFGAGKRKLKGFVNVDVDNRFNPEILWDMNKFPYPFKNNSAEKIICEMTLEHINEPTRAIDEFHRIINKQGYIYILVPHFSHHGSHLAEWHISVFNTDYFWARKTGIESPDELNWNPLEKKFKDVSVEIIFPKGKLAIISFPFQLLFGKNRLMQQIYESTFLRSLYPASDIKVVLGRKK